MQAAAAASMARTTSDGLSISASQIQRLEKKRKYAKDMYDSLKINQLTNHGKDDDPARRKKEDSTLVDLRKQIKLSNKIDQPKILTCSISNENFFDSQKT